MIYELQCDKINNNYFTSDKMTDSNSQSRLVSYEQVKSIIDFMGQHVEFASGNLRSLEARHTSKRLWEELTKMLNSCRGGTRKTSDGWSKVNT